MRLGTRGSKLAMAQSQQVADEVARVTGDAVELVEITTPGDRSMAPVTQLGVGVFVSALREALEEDRIDVAVHSFKDLPTAQPDHLSIVAVPPRADARDALIASGKTLIDLPEGSRIGTGSPRRISQLLALGRGFECVPIRGNIDTRMARVGDDLDAVVLASAGLIRVGRQGEISEFLDPLQMLPAPAQGALAVECRKSDKTLSAILGKLNDRYSQTAVAAERGLLARLEAGCSAPVAALADVSEGEEPGDIDIYLRGAAIALDGSHTVKLSSTATVAADDDVFQTASNVGRALAEELLAEGAAELLK
ncbi:hydroxymethylbilane synthase [Natronoglycomyces albus]|uniref:hydroxymethylbilane synthase n=1 Tax=Natronoglycomyces albus TaxID=2811108 RepID=UPI003CCCFDB7